LGIAAKDDEQTFNFDGVGTTADGAHRPALMTLGHCTSTNSESTRLKQLRAKSLKKIILTTRALKQAPSTAIITLFSAIL